MLETIIQTLRWTHILAGFTAFFVAPIALITQKGGPAHRRWGQSLFLVDDGWHHHRIARRRVSSQYFFAAHCHFQFLSVVHRLSRTRAQATGYRTKGYGIRLERCHVHRVHERHHARTRPF